RRFLPALERRFDLDGLHGSWLLQIHDTRPDWRLALAVPAEEAVLGSRVRVEVIGDVAHVTVHPEFAELRRGDLAQPLAHVRDVRVRRGRAVEAPDDHRRLADLAFGDPADVVLEEPGRQLQGAAQVAVRDAGELGTDRRRCAHGAIPYRKPCIEAL